MWLGATAKKDEGGGFLKHKGIIGVTTLRSGCLIVTCNTVV